MNNDARFLWFVRINTRLRRRGIIVALYTSMVLGCLFSTLSQASVASPFLRFDYAVMLTSFLVAAAAWLALAQSLREYGFAGDHRLDTSRDERQGQVRHAAYVRAYWILMGLVCLFSVVFLSSTLESAVIDTASRFSKPLIPAMAIVLAVSLPSAVIAWSERDLEEA